MRTLVVSMLALVAAAPAMADTLPEAMVAAVESNPTLAAQRQRLNATREALPQAWAEALPQISLSGSATRRSDDTPLPTSETWNASASASQLLFGGGRVLANTRAARAQITGAVADYDNALQNLLLNVTQAYADVRGGLSVLTARETTVSNLTTLLEYSQAQFDAGVVTRTDVAQAQARLAQARTQLVQAQGSFAAAVQAYQRVVGRPPSDLQPPPDVSDLPSDLQAALDTAGRQSPVLLSAVADTVLADANVDLAASAGRLRVTLEGSEGIAADFDDDDSEVRSDSIGVRMSVPLFQGGAIRSRTRQQRANRAAINLDLAATQRSVQESVTNAWTGLASAQAAVVSAREQVQASELAYEGVRLEQETGLRSTVEVLDQEQDLLNARIALATAERDLVVAQRQLQATTGTLTVPQGGAATDSEQLQLRGR